MNTCVCLAHDPQPCKMVASNDRTLNLQAPELESPTLQLAPEITPSLRVAVTGTVHLLFLEGGITLSTISVENTDVCLDWPSSATKMLIATKSEYAEIGPIHFRNHSCDPSVEGRM